MIVAVRDPSVSIWIPVGVVFQLSGRLFSSVIIRFWYVVPMSVTLFLGFVGSVVVVICMCVVPSGYWFIMRLCGFVCAFIVVVVVSMIASSSIVVCFFIVFWPL